MSTWSEKLRVPVRDDDEFEQSNWANSDLIPINKGVSRSPSRHAPKLTRKSTPHLWCWFHHPLLGDWRFLHCQLRHWCRLYCLRSIWAASSGELYPQRARNDIDDDQICAIVAPIILTAAIIPCAWIGASHHIGFTVSQRMVHGLRGSFLIIILRSIPCVVYDGIEGESASIRIAFDR